MANQKMTYAEAKNYLLHCVDEAKSKDWASGIKFALATIEKATEQDCISRQAVIEALTKTSGIRGDALKALYDLPPVTPQPKMGRWINIDATHSKCDRCRAVFEIASENGGEANYCPNCGQPKMQEAEE